MSPSIVCEVGACVGVLLFDDSGVGIVVEIGVLVAVDGAIGTIEAEGFVAGRELLIACGTSTVPAEPMCQPMPIITPQVRVTPAILDFLTS
jgi:hypothetical protein